MLYELVYCSIAVRTISHQDIVDILNTARKFNAENHITGCLLYHQHEFIQILEGDEETILKLYDDICKDKRHGNIKLVYKGYIETRAFSGWDMAFKELTKQDTEGIKNQLNLTEFQTLLKSVAHTNATKKMFAYLSEVILKE